MCPQTSSQIQTAAGKGSRSSGCDLGLHKDHVSGPLHERGKASGVAFRNMGLGLYNAAAENPELRKKGHHTFQQQRMMCVCEGEATCPRCAPKEELSFAPKGKTQSSNLSIGKKNGYKRKNTNPLLSPERKNERQAPLAQRNDNCTSKYSQREARAARARRAKTRKERSGPGLNDPAREE